MASSNPLKDENDKRPTIVMRPMDAVRVIDKLEDALLEAGSPIYQRGGRLVRPVRLDQPVGEKEGNKGGKIETSDGAKLNLPVYHPNGTTILVDVDERWVWREACKVAKWAKLVKRGNVRIKVPEDPKTIYTNGLLSMKGEWRFPALKGVATAPTLLRDGHIVQTPGYDPVSGLLLDIKPGCFPPIPEHPTKDDAIAALKKLAHPLRGFPFASPASRSVALSALLTGLVRLSLRTAPLHGLDSPQPSSGKSMLAEAIGVLVTGALPPSMSQGKTEEEDEKRLSSILAAGDPVILLDNCKLDITGDFLCSMLTQEYVQHRILGQSERRTTPASSLVLATGNNLTFRGDVARRCVICRLDAKMERPDERKFTWDPRDVFRAQRAEYVTAGLTVLRAYIVAGSPVKLTAMGSFDDYEWIRGALVWCGEADPNETRTSIFDNDPAREELIEVMALWDTAFKHRKVRVVDIEHLGNENDAVAALRARLIDIACHHGTWSGKSVGRWMMRHKDQVSGNKAFLCNVDAKNGNQWQLMTTTGQTKLEGM